MTPDQIMEQIKLLSGTDFFRFQCKYSWYLITEFIMWHISIVFIIFGLVVLYVVFTTRSGKSTNVITLDTEKKTLVIKANQLVTIPILSDAIYIVREIDANSIYLVTKYGVGENYVKKFKIGNENRSIITREELWDIISTATNEEYMALKLG